MEFKDVASDGLVYLSMDAERTQRRFESAQARSETRIGVTVEEFRQEACAFRFGNLQIFAERNLGLRNRSDARHLWFRLKPANNVFLNGEFEDSPKGYRGLRVKEWKACRHLLSDGRCIGLGRLDAPFGVRFLFLAMCFGNGSQRLGKGLADGDALHGPTQEFVDLLYIAYQLLEGLNEDGKPGLRGR